MLSKREKLLIRPWEQLRFQNHRDKVAKATPAIDFGPPVPRDHVKLKLKKCQKEAERCEKIAQDNIKLLQRLQSIMKVNKLDNYWTEAPPNFLNRETIFKPKSTRSSAKSGTTDSNQFTRPKTCSHLNNCKACNDINQRKQEIPEKRVPWPNIQKNVSKKIIKPFESCSQCGTHVRKC